MFISLEPTIVAMVSSLYGVLLSSIMASFSKAFLCITPTLLAHDGTNSTNIRDFNVTFLQGSLKDSYIPCRRMTMERPKNSRLKLVAFSCDLDLESAWVLHIISLRRTFDQRLKKILPGVKEIWSWHHIQGSNSWPSTVTLTLSPQGWIMGSAHCPTEVNI